MQQRMLGLTIDENKIFEILKRKHEKANQSGSNSCYCIFDNFSFN